MAKKRYINTKFWSDDFIIGLKPLERYFFLYLLTNEHTEICGIYELSMKVIERETDLTNQQIIDILNVLKSKVVYTDGWVRINNFAKHQAVNPKIEIGIERSLSEIPEDILAKLSNNDIDYNSLSKTTIETELLKPKLILKPKLKPKLKPIGVSRFNPPTLEEQLKPFTNSYPPSMITDFTLYWDETDTKGTPRWKKEKTWNIDKRLLKWKRNQEKWDYQKTQKFIKVEEKTERKPEERTNSGFSKINFV